VAGLNASYNALEMATKSGDAEWFLSLLAAEFSRLSDAQKSSPPWRLGLPAASLEKPRRAVGRVKKPV
jgi:hypothetical protein